VNLILCNHRCTCSGSSQVGVPIYFHPLDCLIDGRTGWRRFYVDCVWLSQLQRVIRVSCRLRQWLQVQYDCCWITLLRSLTRCDFHVIRHHVFSSKKLLIWSLSDFHEHWVFSGINHRKSGPYMALLVVLVAKYDPVLPELYMPRHNGSHKMHQQSTKQLFQLFRNNTTKVDVWHN